MVAWFKIEDGRLVKCSKSESNTWWHNEFEDTESTTISYDSVPSDMPIETFDGEPHTIDIMTIFRGTGGSKYGPLPYDTEVDTGEGEMLVLAEYATSTLALIGHRAIVELCRTQGVRAVIQEYKSFMSKEKV